MLDFAFVKPALPRHGALVLPVAEDAALAGLAQAIDTATGGAVARALAAAGFKGRKGQSCTIWAPSAEAGGPSKLVAVGLGKAGELTAEGAEAAGGAAATGIAGGAPPLSALRRRWRASSRATASAAASAVTKLPRWCLPPPPRETRASKRRPERETPR